MSIIQFFVPLVLLVTIVLNCKSDKNEYNDLLSIASGLSPAYQATITNLSVRKGSPRIQTSYADFPATKVIITGRNFSYIPTDLSVTFNNVPAPIEYSSDTQIFTSVPTGASSGLLKVVKSGGNCYSLDGKSGFNCSALEFYIDCYASSNKIFGEETSLTPGVLNTVTFDDTGIKPFRVDLPPGNFTLNVTCNSTVGIQTYSNSCVATTQTVNGSSVLFNPQLPIIGGYTVQFLMYSIKGNCKIGIF
jgi:hypothetical protein